MSQAAILKSISTIYSERLKSHNMNNQNAFHVNIYDFFLNRYGFKKIAENKYSLVIIIFFVLFKLFYFTSILAIFNKNRIIVFFNYKQFKSFQKLIRYF